MFNRLAEQILHAPDEQHVVVLGTGAAGIVLPELAGMLAGIHAARTKVLTRVEALVEAHPLHPVLTSVPAVGVRTAARILTDVVGKDFRTAATSPPTPAAPSPGAPEPPSAATTPPGEATRH